MHQATTIRRSAMRCQLGLAAFAVGIWQYEVTDVTRNGGEARSA
jgi:hypothetical protein